MSALDEAIERAQDELVAAVQLTPREADMLARASADLIMLASRAPFEDVEDEIDLNLGIIQDVRLTVATRSRAEAAAAAFEVLAGLTAAAVGAVRRSL